MKLYYSTGACSLAPHIVMAEYNMAYELEAVNLKDKTCASGDFKTINPKGSVPALKMENGEVLTECAIICQYICDQKNDGMMLPKFGTNERFRTLEWMNSIGTEVHKYFTPLFFADRAYTNADTVNDVKNHMRKILSDKFNYISEKLGNSDYLMGTQFTIADAYMFNCMMWTKYVGMDINNWSNLSTYMKRVSERPAVMKAMKEEGLLK